MTLYLTRAHLIDDISIQALTPALLGNSGAHRLAWSLMSDGPDRERDFLFRETDGGMMVLSDREPPGSRLWEHQTRRLPEFEAGDVLQFSLRANPVIRRKRDDGRTVKMDAIMDALHSVPSGERADVRMDTALRVTSEWLARIGQASGYDLRACAVEGYRQRRIRNRGISFGVVDVVGELAVTDGDAFGERLRQGFGSSRAWGCGLMLVRRI